MENKKKEKSGVVKNTDDENKKGIKNHKKAALHLEEAAKYHLKAAMHHKNGAEKKAAKSTLKAQGHFSLASDAQREDVKHHAC